MGTPVVNGDAVVAAPDGVVLTWDGATLATGPDFDVFGAAFTWDYAASSSSQAGAASFTGSGTLVAAGIVVAAGAADLTGSGTLVAAALGAQTGAAALTGSGTLVAAGAVVVSTEPTVVSVPGFVVSGRL